MNFCQNCGAILKPQEGKLLCSCGHMQDAMTRRVTEKHEKQEQPAGIVDHTVHPLASFDHVCSKCGFGKAQLVGKGVFVTDEDESIEYICGRCGHHDPETGLKIT